MDKVTAAVAVNTLAGVSEKCARPTCPKPTTRHSDLCRQHYQVERRMGLRGMTAAKPTQDRIRELVDAEWTYADIAKAAGVSPTFVRVHALRKRDTIRATEARKILAVTADTTMPRTPYTTMDGTGFVRRLQALACLGWRYEDLTERLGCAYQTITAVPDRGVVARALHDKMVALYDQLQHQQGPSRIVAIKARNKGWHPPAAWDDIDTDRETPTLELEGEIVDEVLVRRVLDGFASPRSMNRAERDEAARILLAKGYSPTTIGNRLNMAYHHVKKVAAA